MIYKCSLYDIADNSRITSERYGNDKTIKLCDNCRCDQCIENENRYSDERIV